MREGRFLSLFVVTRLHHHVRTDDTLLVDQTRYRHDVPAAAAAAAAAIPKPIEHPAGFGKTFLATHQLGYVS